MNKSREVMLVNISGKDKPGLTSSLTEILSHYGVNIPGIGLDAIFYLMGFRDREIES